MTLSAMKLPRLVSPRPEFLIALGMFLLVNVLSFLFQPQIGINDGKGWDGAAYYTVAQEIATGQALIAEAPFVYRVGTPFLASLVSRNDLVLGFKIINLAANCAMTLLLLAFLRLYVKDWRVRLALVAAFLLEWHGPVRFTHFYPVAADNLMVTMLLGGLLAIHSVRNRVAWRTIATLSALAIVGTLVRESGLLLALILPFARNPIRFEWRLPRFPVGFLMPLAVAGIGFVGVHAVAHLTNTTSASDAGGLIVPKSAAAYGLGWFTAFGPLLILPLFTWRRTAAFLWQHQSMLALLLAVTVLGSFQSPALQLQLQDTERYLFWAMPVMYVLIGRALEHLLPIMTRPLLGFLVVSQALAERAFWAIPMPNAIDSESAFRHGTSAILLLTPLGNNVQYFDIFPAWMSQTYRLILIGEYVGVGIVLLGWLYWLGARAPEARRSLAAATA
jgi:hypothetical protein